MATPAQTRTAIGAIVVCLAALHCFGQSGASRFAMLDGARVYYESSGEGKEALLFIHGWSCDHSFWKHQAPVWAKRRALLIDLPGHGRSDKPELAYTMDHFARGVDAVMRDAGVERAVLIGHSMGGPVARQVLRNYPKRVKAVVLVDSYFRRPPPDAAQRDKWIADWMQMVAPFKAPSCRQHATKFVEAMFAPGTVPELRREILRVMLATPQYVMVSALENIGDPDLWHEDRFDVPALEVVAQRKEGPQGNEDFMRNIFPKLQYVEMTDCGHFLMQEQPAKFNAILLDFLKKL